MPKIKKLISEDNDFQRAEVLKNNRNKRSKYGAFFVEGVKALKSGIEFGWELDSLYFSSEQGLSDWASGVIGQFKDVKRFDLKPALLSKLSEKDEVSELMAAFKIPPDNPGRINIHKNLLLVVFDRPASPGNLGTSIRSCDCLGVDGIIVTGHAADIYHPQCVRGSMGALFSLPVIRMESHNDLIKWLRSIEELSGRATIIGSSAKAERPLYEIDLSGPTVLVFGNETSGMSQGYFELCDKILTIPQGGYASSINISCALSVVLYEAMRQRM